MGCIFSTDQQSVIDSRKQNVLVSAAAGSGKTSVLTERIIQRILDENPGDSGRVNIDRILVVTFTKAAAAEMKGRIAKALEQALVEKPHDAHLQKQSSLIHNAMITTIDSFCLNVVKNNFHKINLDPSFRPAANGEQEMLQEDVMKALIKKYYASEDEDFFFMVDSYGKKAGDESVETNIKSLYNMAMSNPWPKLWLEERRKDYAFETVEEMENSDFAGDLVRICRENIESFIPAAEDIIERLYTEGGQVGAIVEKVENDIETAKKAAESLRGRRLSELPALADSFKFSQFRFGKDTPADIKDKYKDERKAFVDAVKDEYKKLVQFDVETQLELMKLAGRVENKLIDMTIEFIDDFTAAKRDRGIIDFSDMEHMAIDILVDSYNEDGTYTISDVAEGYRNFFAEVMVDEYQDSNLVQEIIIQSVSREGDLNRPNRFMVGDVKQSIYRFRLARSKIFLDKMNAYSKDAEAKDRLITLKKNFRSRKIIIDSVNAVFKKAMTKETSGMDYDDDAKLYFGATYTEDTPENKSELIFAGAQGSATERRKQEAAVAVKRITELVGNMMVTDKETRSLRPAEYRDIAILCRATKSWGPILKEAFESCDIPYYLEGTGAFFETREIRDVLDFLRIIDNPLNDVALCASLTSSFGNFTDDELALIKVKAEPEDYYFWDKFKTYFSKHSDNDKAASFLALVERYRKLVKILPIQKLILTLLDETGYRNIVAALPDGNQRLANLELLTVKAAEYAKTSFSGLFHFLRYVELVKRMNADESEASVFDENANVVRVLTIHKSKGLEFPIIMIMGVDDGFNTKDEQKNFILDVDAGIGAQFVDPVRHIKGETLRRTYVREVVHHENIAEELRVLYVAMTRAKEKLIMFAGEKLPDDEDTVADTDWDEDSEGDWNEAASVDDTSDYSEGYRVPLKKKSYLDFIMAAEDRELYFDEIHVTPTDEIKEAVKQEVDRIRLRNELDAAAKTPDAELLSKLKDRFSFEYPYKNLETLYTKTTVSELKLIAMAETDEEAAQEFHGHETELYVPKFAGGEEEVRGSRRGTAYHTLLQLLNFAAFVDLDSAGMRAELEGQKARILEADKMSREDMDLIFDKKILEFLGTDVAKTMGRCEAEGTLFKEQPFVLGVPANTLDENFPASETVLVQGVIDVYYVVDGKAIILDYKTDRIDSATALADRYRKQLDYYGAAVHQLTGHEIAGEVIYSFSLSEVINL